MQHPPTHTHVPQVNTKASLITACTMLCGIACIIMGIIGNVPLGMVIGMGLAPYFTYNVVGFHGSGSVRLIGWLVD